MFSGAKQSGDHGSVGEELLIDVPMLEERVRMVEMAVGNGYFSLDKALSLYKVSEVEYVAYLLLKHKKDLEAISKSSQILEVVAVLVGAFQAASHDFDSNGKNVMQQLETISHDRKLVKVG
ncbi:MAG: hypothetical protein ABW007_13145 [Chitinophagaceae bacterium]